MFYIGQLVGLSVKIKVVFVVQVVCDVGINIYWFKDSKCLYWILGEELFSDDFIECFSFLKGSFDSLLFMDIVGLCIGLELKVDWLEGIVVFINV